MKVFHNLTQGFKVLSQEGDWLVSCVDDLTLQAGLSRSQAPKPGWFRIVSDDERFLRLFVEQVAPEATLAEALNHFAKLFGTQAEPGPRGLLRVVDKLKKPVLMGALLPGERERPCELVTAPIITEHNQKLSHYLSYARELGFSLPEEGATHLHFDATPFRNPQNLARLVKFLSHFGEPLKALLKVNPRCQRLGPWQQDLLQTVSHPDFETLSWAEAQSRLMKVGLTKYCDFNILNLVGDHPYKKTIEFRTMPSYLEAEPIVESALKIQRILHWILENNCEDMPKSLSSVV